MKDHRYFKPDDNAKTPSINNIILFNSNISIWRPIMTAPRSRMEATVPVFVRPEVGDILKSGGWR